MKNNAPQLSLSPTILIFQDGQNYFQIDKEKQLLSYNILTLGKQEKVEPISIAGITFHINTLRGDSTFQSTGRELAGLYIMDKIGNRTQIAHFQNALTLYCIVERWLSTEHPDFEELHEMFAAGCKPIPVLRITLFIAAIVAIISAIGEYIA